MVRRSCCWWVAPEAAARRQGRGGQAMTTRRPPGEVGRSVPQSNAQWGGDARWEPHLSVLWCEPPCEGPWPLRGTTEPNPGRRWWRDVWVGIAFSATYSSWSFLSVLLRNAMMSASRAAVEEVPGHQQAVSVRKLTAWSAAAPCSWLASRLGRRPARPCAAQGRENDDGGGAFRQQQQQLTKTARCIKPSAPAGPA